ncbi:MAG: hypothetical protein Q8J62_03175, partial [Candidatus Cloacimonadaceae bacterium]|nr:hypothetical protein [Candidatus Cloacimonadaceae bacterium]
IIEKALRHLNRAQARMESKDELMRLLISNASLEGARLISFLASHPGCSYLPEDIVWALDSRGMASLPHTENNIPRELPIPHTDAKTLRDVNRRLLKLSGLRSMRLAVEQDTLCVDAEIAFLKNYLQECTRPGGIIKMIQFTDRRCYHRLHAAIKRFMTKIRSSHPHCHALIKSHLNMGRVFVWKGGKVCP